MKIGISKIRIRILRRRISSFMIDFRSSKVGLIGLGILLAFIIVGILAPLITPYDPYKTMLAYETAMPAWVKIFPQYNDLPETYFSSINFTQTTMNENVIAEYANYDPELIATLSTMGENITKLNLLRIKYCGNTTDSLEFKMIWNFTYNYAPPPIILLSFRWRAVNLSDIGYNIEMSFISSNQSIEYSLWDNNYSPSNSLRNTAYKYTYPYELWPRNIQIRSDYVPFINRIAAQLNMENLSRTELCKKLFDKKGEYSLILYVRLLPKSTTATCQIDIINLEFGWLGAVHGLLGTDHEGADVFSRVLIGVRISLTIGLMVAVISTAIGAIVGVTAGYFGGFIDEASMRIVDILLCLPLLPLLLALISIFGRDLYLIMLLLVLFSWMGLARTIRSQVLQLREMAFIDAAIVSGAKKHYILFKHVLPNVMPMILTAMMLFIPGAILTEAALSFLGFGDPGTMTWGRMINQAMNFGGFQKLAWWWIFSPAVAIILLCTGFVFLSHALDKIFNPRLRRRR
jgi:ABC-type dipeptide/oligopeptide/nickel transport system permease subunit